MAGGTEICAVMGTVTGVPLFQVSVRVEENAPSVVAGMISTTESIAPGASDDAGWFGTIEAEPTGVIDATRF